MSLSSKWVWTWLDLENKLTQTGLSPINRRIRSSRIIVDLQYFDIFIWYLIVYYFMQRLLMLINAIQKLSKKRRTCMLSLKSIYSEQAQRALVAVYIVIIFIPLLNYHFWKQNFCNLRHNIGNSLLITCKCIWFYYVKGSLWIEKFYLLVHYL